MKGLNSPPKQLVVVHSSVVDARALSILDTTQIYCVTHRQDLQDLQFRPEIDNKIVRRRSEYSTNSQRESSIKASLCLRARLCTLVRIGPVQLAFKKQVSSNSKYGKIEMCVRSMSHKRSMISQITHTLNAPSVTPSAPHQHTYPQINSI